MPPAASDTLRASPQGWRWQAPLPDRTITGTLSADEAGSPVRPGRRPAPWVRNVLAVGDAALALDPLHWLPLHAAQQAILRALELLPDSACNPVETGEYNRRARLESERLRDFQLLHHRQAGWEKLPPSPGLAETLQQFERRGRLVRFDEDSLTAEMWLAALLGLGVMPQAMDPLADTLSPDDAASGMDALAKGLLPVIDRLPDYAAWLSQAGVRA
jgi:tryptophan halogenase